MLGALLATTPATRSPTGPRPAPGIEAGGGAEQVPDVAALPAPVAHVDRARLRHRHRRDLPARGPARAGRPGRGRADARGAARRQERDRHRPRAGDHPRPRSDRMSVAAAPEPAAVLERAPPAPPARRDRRLGQRRAGADARRSPPPAATTPRSRCYRRARPRHRARALVAAGRAARSTRARSTTRLASASTGTLARIPADIPVHTHLPPRQGRSGDRQGARKEGDYDAIMLGARGVGRVGAMMGSVSRTCCTTPTSPCSSPTRRRSSARNNPRCPAVLERVATTAQVLDVGVGSPGIGDRARSVVDRALGAAADGDRVAVDGDAARADEERRSRRRPRPPSRGGRSRRLGDAPPAACAR